MDEQFQSICDEIRGLAKDGAPIPEMFRAIQAHTGEIRSTIFALRVFYQVFNMSLFELHDLGLWNGFNSGNPGVDDDELEERYGTRVRRSLR